MQEMKVLCPLSCPLDGAAVTLWGLSSSTPPPAGGDKHMTPSASHSETGHSASLCYLGASSSVLSLHCSYYESYYYFWYDISYILFTVYHHIHHILLKSLKAPRWSPAPRPLADLWGDWSISRPHTPIPSYDTTRGAWNAESLCADPFSLTTFMHETNKKYFAFGKKW